MIATEISADKLGRPEVNEKSVLTWPEYLFKYRYYPLAGIKRDYIRDMYVLTFQIGVAFASAGLVDMMTHRHQPNQSGGVTSVPSRLGQARSFGLVALLGTIGVGCVIAQYQKERKASEELTTLDAMLLPNPKLKEKGTK